MQILPQAMFQHAKTCAHPHIYMFQFTYLKLALTENVGQNTSVWAFCMCLLNSPGFPLWKRWTEEDDREDQRSCELRGRGTDDRDQKESQGGAIIDVFVSLEAKEFHCCWSHLALLQRTGDSYKKDSKTSSAYDSYTLSTHTKCKDTDIHALFFSRHLFPHKLHIKRTAFLFLNTLNYYFILQNMCCKIMILM